MTYGPLTADEKFIMAHTSMFGSTSYPLRKMSGRWFVIGMRDLGSCPSAFKTKREATGQWEAYLKILRDRLAGRL